MNFSLSIFPSAKDFLRNAGKRLYTQSAVNSLMLGVCERLVSEPDAVQDPFFAVIKDSKDVPQLAGVMTPPHNIILAGWEDPPAAHQLLVQHLLETRRTVPGAIGPLSIVNTFVKCWEATTGQAYATSMHQRVYELRQVQMPEIPEGRCRCATPEDMEIVSEWLRDFEKEALSETRQPDRIRARRLVNQKNVFFWQIGDSPVSMAMRTRPIQNSITISGVYTPPKYRQRGFATACVAILSHNLLSQGYETLTLFTDLANPTSNAIYQKIGFRPVCDFRMVDFLPKVGEDQTKDQKG